MTGHLPPELWPHQREAIDFAAERGGSMLAMGLGTGKSRVAITLGERWGARRVLIVCPNSVLRVWPAQFELHAEQDWTVVNGLRVNRRGRVAGMPIAQRIEQAGYALGESGPVAVVVNYEAMVREPMRGWLLDQSWDAVVYDEAHRLKNAASRTSLTALHLRSRCARRLGLTGTPLAQGPWDVYGIARALDPTVFGPNRWRFLDRYFECDDYGNPRCFAPGAERWFEERLGTLAFICDSDEVLDLPPVRDLPPRHCTLGSTAQKAHDDLDRQLHARLDRGDIRADMVLTAMLRMSQLAGGYAAITGPGGSENTVPVDDAKLRLLKDVLQEIDGGPFVVFCRFTAEIEAVLAVGVDQGLRCAELSGRDRDGLTADGQMSGDVDLLVVQYQAGGSGVDLSRARGVIWYSPTFSVVDYEQSRGRVHRPGQARPVWYLRLIAAGTIDERVWDCVDRRVDLISELIVGARNEKAA